MNSEELSKSLAEYTEQMSMITEALNSSENQSERESLLTLQNDLKQLIQLTQESLDALNAKTPVSNSSESVDNTAKAGGSSLDDEYALFMQEMAQTGAYDEQNEQTEKAGCSKDSKEMSNNSDSDIEDELATLLGMKCAVYHTHKWGGEPTLHNAMVSSVLPRQEDDQFKDLLVRVMYTHPTHTEMLPCPYFLEGDCKFDDEQCRYSHGAIVQLSNLKEAIEPNFDTVRVGTRVLLKIEPPDDQDISITKKSTEIYHLWHRGIIKSLDQERKSCMVTLEHRVKTGEKRKTGADDLIACSFEKIFPLNNEEPADTDSEDSLSDTEYPDSKAARTEDNAPSEQLAPRLADATGLAMGEWERHTRGIGSKLMLSMGYLPGRGLGAASDGRVLPVEARVLPQGKSLDHCMLLSENNAALDPLKVEQKLKRMQNKEEERNKRAYEREKERERRNVFNFLNRTLGNNSNGEVAAAAPATDIKQSTSKDLNIEQFKITEDCKKIERDIMKLNSSLQRHSAGTSAHRNLNMTIAEKTKELNLLKSRESQITKEQLQRKDKQKMTIF